MLWPIGTITNLATGLFQLILGYLVGAYIVSLSVCLSAPFDTSTSCFEGGSGGFRSQVAKLTTRPTAAT